MAFTFAPNWTSAKYRYSFTGDEGTSYIWEIHEDGYNNGGSPTSIDASGRDNCITSWKNEGKDEYSPLMTSETKISLFDPSLNVINDLLDALSTGSISDVEEKYRLVVRSGDNLKWVGNIDPEGITYEEDGVTQLNITATDGIGRLGNKPYITNTATGTLPNGVDSIKNIFVELLDYTGFDLDIYMSSSFYPKAMYSLPSQGVNSNPLEYIYANKYHFRDVQGINDSILAWTIPAQEVLSAQGFLDPGDIDKDDRPISVHSALVGLLKSLGLRIVQQDGIWHIIQCNHLAKATTYKRWKYDSTGAAIGSPNYEDVTSGLSISNITVARTRSRVSTLPSYSSSVVTYAHGSSNMIRLGKFGNITKAGGAYNAAYPWTAGNASLSARADRDGGFSGWHIDDVNEDPTQKTGFTRIDDFPGIFNFDDSSGSFTTSIGGRTASQTTNIESQSGDKLNLQFEVFAAPKGVTVGSIDLLGRETPEISGDAFVAVQLKLNTSTPRYLELIEPRAGEWTTTPTWMSWSWLSLQDFSSIFVTTNAVPSDATITVTLGPIFDGKGNQVGSCYYDNVALYPVESDGAISFTATSYVNYIDRADPRPRQHSVKFGDGPTAYTSGALYTASDRSAFTADWEEVLNTGGSASGHSGADTNEELPVVLGRAILKSTNRIRTVHDRAFNGAGQVLLPLDVILDGSRYAPHSLDANWVEEYSSGSWVKLDENGFTDDLETAIKSGGSSLSDWGRGTGYNSGLVLNGLQQSFISDNSKRITRTTAAIPAGNTTASVAVEEIAEPLLNDNDTIVIISPTLEWYRVKITQDQLAADTEIFFDDPDAPGSNFDFPNKIPAGANIFVADDELLTLVRTGAQGFAVTVLGQDLGTVNESPGGSASYTDIDVTDWNATVRTGSTIEVQQTDGSYVTAQLWSDAYKGATNIQITLPGEPDTQTSIPMDLSSGKKISPSGSVSRADFTVTADAITSYISTDGDLIATIDEPASTGITVETDTNISSTLKAGDAVYFHGAASGRVFKRTVATVGSPTVNDFTVTSAFGGDDVLADGDYVFGGTLVGMRIDADGVDFVNTHIKSDNWASSGGVIDDDPASATYGEITTNGTAGWVITKSGEAEFANLTVRGTLSTLEGTLTVNTGGLFTDGISYELGPDGLDFLIPGSPSAVTQVRWLDALGSTTAGADVTLGAYFASVVEGVLDIESASVRLDTSAFSASAGNKGIFVDSAQFHGTFIDYSSASSSEIIGSNTTGLKLKSTSASTSFVWPGSPGNNGDVLTSDGSGGLTFSAAGSGGATSLSGLSDVTITSVATGNLLRYNGSAWVNYPDSSYAAASHNHSAADITSGTLASARISGSYTGITGVGALSAGSIASGFGSIATANTISTTSKIYVGGSTYASDGIQLDYNAGNPRFYVGDGANSYFEFNGATAKLNGGLVTNISSGSDIGIQGWSSDLIFSASDADTVAWTSGTITLADGTSYSSIAAGNTGNMTALTYIYFDSAQSTILKTTTTAGTAIGNGKILVAVAQENTDTGATEAVFQAFGGRGGQLLNAASIAANSITANEIAANTITAAQINAGTITANELAANSVTASKIDVTDLSAVNTSTGSLSVTGDLTMNSYVGSEWAAAKITSAGDIYANDGYFESLTTASSGLTVYSSTAGPAFGTLAYANGVFTVDGDDVISEGSIGNGLSYASFTLKADSSVASGTAGYGGDSDTLTLKTGDGRTVLILCEDVT